MTRLREAFAWFFILFASAALCLAWLLVTILAPAWLTETAQDANMIFPALVGFIALKMLILAVYFGVRERRQVIGPGR